MSNQDASRQARGGLVLENKSAYPAKAVVDVIHKVIAQWVGVDATRETAAMAYDSSAMFEEMLPELREAVLDRFQPTREPKAYLDFLPSETRP